MFGDVPLIMEVLSDGADIADENVIRAVVEITTPQPAELQLPYLETPSQMPEYFA